MTLTIRAGSFTTTGQARVVEQTEANRELLADMILTDSAELLTDGTGRVRVWLQDAATQELLKAQRFELASDQVLDIVPDEELPLYYTIELGMDPAGVDVLVRQRLANGFDYPELPPDWYTLHPLVYEFELSPKAKKLPDIFVLKVEPGFPPGTGPDDWKIHAGLL